MSYVDSYGGLRLQLRWAKFAATMKDTRNIYKINHLGNTHFLNRITDFLTLR